MDFRQREQSAVKKENGNLDERNNVGVQRIEDIQRLQQQISLTTLLCRGLGPCENRQNMDEYLQKHHDFFMRNSDSMLPKVTAHDWIIL